MKMLDPQGSPSGVYVPSVSQGLPTLIVMIVVLVIIVLFCFWGAPAVRAFCRKKVCCCCPMDEPNLENASIADGSATPTIILLPYGRMLVVDRAVFAQLQADHTGIDFLELSANLIRAQRLQGSNPSILDSDATSKGLSPTSIDFLPPAYEEIFGARDLPPSYSEISIMFRRVSTTSYRSECRVEVEDSRPEDEAVPAMKQGGEVEGDTILVLPTNNQAGNYSLHMENGLSGDFVKNSSKVCTTQPRARNSFSISTISLVNGLAEKSLRDFHTSIEEIERASANQPRSNARKCVLVMSSTSNLRTCSVPFDELPKQSRSLEEIPGELCATGYNRRQDDRESSV